MLRLEIEKREERELAPWATFARQSNGRKVYEEEDEIRTCFMRDRDRIIHSKAFRRLKDKTQVYISPINDHYRTRLTHTLEVSQIGRTIGRALSLNEDLIEAIALAHDVGHTPFSHAGEEVLDRLMPNGFRHNENSVRVLEYIEDRNGKRGLNLSIEVLDGIIHHNGYGSRIEEAETLEGQVIRLCDKIAYVQHDIDDSLRAGIIEKEDLPQEYIRVLGETHSKRISKLVTDAVEYTRALIELGEKPRIGLPPETEVALKGLRDFMFKNVYKGDFCKQERERAEYAIEYLFRYFLERPELMPEFYREVAINENPERGVCDYIAGMSDNYCIRLFQEAIMPRSLLDGYREEP